MEARLESLTGLRWWAAFGVFFYHMANLAPLPVSELLDLGNYGVMFFFVLSGFVLTWSARPGTTVGTFYWRRFARIYPAHFVALLLAIPVFYSVSPDPEQWWVKPLDVGVLLLSVLLIQGWWSSPVVFFSGNPAAWTLTVEAFFYALHPWLQRVLAVLRSRGALIVAIALLVLSFGWRMLEFASPAVASLPIPVPLSRLAEFVIGMCLASAMKSGWRLPLPPWTVLAGGAALAFVLTYDAGTAWLDPVREFVRATQTEWVLVFCTLLIASVASRDALGGRSWLRHKWMVRLGEASYAFYLVHATVIYFVLGFVGVQSLGWWGIVWYPPLIIAALALAFALHLGVEKPVERRMRRWWDARLERKQATESAARHGGDPR
ncbi:MAG: acyltransferase [Microbacterium sp.]|nr:acyltransferase [Microbacterium sp.]MBA4346863.1 acyltransferase [Microbacterium sp.]